MLFKQILIISLFLPSYLALSQDLSEPIRPKAFNQYHELKNLEKAYSDSLLQAEKTKKLDEQWNALMGLVWVYYNTSRTSEALIYGVKSYFIANQLQDEFRQGRSLDFLASNLAMTGHYKAALYFYDHAIDIGAPNGEIKYPHVWGLALQEKGYIFFRMGQLEEAKQALKQTIDYATKYGIEAGIMEGCAHRAEIALAEGDIVSAEKYASDALKSAYRFDVVPRNTARAKTVYAKALLAKSKVDEAEVSGAIKHIDESITYAHKEGIPRYEAESLLLKAESLPNALILDRVQISEKALELLTHINDESRGSAQVEFGTALLAQNDIKRAEKALIEGFTVTKQLLRETDNAYVLGRIADLKALQGDTKKELETLSIAAEKAQRTGLNELAFTKYKELGNKLSQFGYLRLAEESLKRSLSSLSSLLQYPLVKERQNQLLYEKYSVLNRLGEIQLKLIKEELSPVIASK